MTLEIEAMPLATLVDVVNGWGSTPRIEAGEDEAPHPLLNSLSGTMDWRALPGTPDDPSLTKIADTIHPVFAATERAHRARLLTTILLDTRVQPSVRADNAGLHDSWTVDNPETALLAAAAVALRAHLATPGPDRLGICAGRRCADVYIDFSPAARRRYCSITCQNRSRVAAFRRRHAATT
jgi:hypothetical protein